MALLQLISQSQQIIDVLAASFEDGEQADTDIVCFLQELMKEQANAIDAVSLARQKLLHDAQIHAENASTLKEYSKSLEARAKKLSDALLEMIQAGVLPPSLDGNTFHISMRKNKPALKEVTPLEDDFLQELALRDPLAVKVKVTYSLDTSYVSQNLDKFPEYKLVQGSHLRFTPSKSPKTV